MKTTNALKTLLKSFEKLELKPYKDLAGFFTIGYGHKILKDDRNLKFVASYTGIAPTEITKEQADNLFELDIAEREEILSSMLPEVNQTQFDALFSFIFNVGLTALQKSTLYRLLEKGDIDGAANQFLVWDYGNGVRHEGLRKRRDIERCIFLSQECPMKPRKDLYSKTLYNDVIYYLSRYAQDIFSEHRIKIEIVE